MKRYMKAIISCLLALVMLVYQPMTVIASASNTYISEVVIETGKSEKEAKDKLTSAGYTVFNKNISNTSNGDERDGYMYIGYKTTNNPDEAITDLRVMNMGGGYSYAEYEALIDEKINEVGGKIDELRIAINEFRTNYNAGVKSAVFAYSMLNRMIEDDSGLLLGDYFLDETVTRAEYIDLFMQCSSVMYLSIIKTLAVACAGTNQGSIFELSELTNEDFEGEVKYEKTAADIYASLSLAQNILLTYANSGVTTADGATVEDIDTAYNGLTDEGKATWNEAFAFAYILESIELFDGSTLYDLVMTDLDELTTEDLYAFASVLSDGQAALIRTAGLKDVISMAVLTEDQWDKMDDYVLTFDGPVSVYTGVDRSLFEGGVALTSKAMVEAAANVEKEWFGSEIDDETENIFCKIFCGSLITFAGAATLYLASTGAFNWLSASISHMVLTADYVNGINFGGSWAAGWISARAGMELVQTIMLYVSQIMTYVAWTAIGVILIAAAIFLIIHGYNYYHPEYDEIPRILVDKSTNENDETIYTNYYSVKNLSGKIIDINQHEGNKWVTLYTTKDKNAGEPLLASLEWSDVNTVSDFTPLCRFSEAAAFNINKFAYSQWETINRDHNGDMETIGKVFIFFKHAPVQTTSTNTGSVFDDGNVLFGIGGVLIGLIGGIGIGTARSKKKEA